MRGSSLYLAFRACGPWRSIVISSSVALQSHIPTETSAGTAREIVLSEHEYSIRSVVGEDQCTVPSAGARKNMRQRPQNQLLWTNVRLPAVAETEMSSYPAPFRMVSLRHPVGCLVVSAKGSRYSVSLMRSWTGFISGRPLATPIEAPCDWVSGVLDHCKIHKSVAVRPT